MLPLILDVARQKEIPLDDYSLSRGKEVRAKCPFCRADALKERKYYLSINTEKNLFKCWFCRESGGALKFLALLENKSTEEVKRELFAGCRVKKTKLHPAERLTPRQLKKIGIKSQNWSLIKTRDYAYYKRTLNWVWAQWQKYVAYQKSWGFTIFLAAETSEERLQAIKNLAEEISVSKNDLMLEFTRYKFGPNNRKPQWVKDAIERANLFGKKVS